MFTMGAQVKVVGANDKKEENFFVAHINDRCDQAELVLSGHNYSWTLVKIKEELSYNEVYMGMINQRKVFIYAN